MISFAILEQSRVILSFVFVGQAGRVVICINSAPTQMIDGTEKPIRSLQMRSDTTNLAIRILVAGKRCNIRGKYLERGSTLNNKKSKDS